LNIHSYVARPIGNVRIEIKVNAKAAELLARDGPLRGGNLQGHEVSKLPLSDLDPMALARTLPGVSDPAGSMVFSGLTTTRWSFSVSGQRPRGNNYLFDRVDNNDPVFAGTAQSFNIPDAMQELSVQSSNFGVEFGRAGGGIFNVITRSGTNVYHGTIFWQYRSERLNGGMRPSHNHAGHCSWTRTSFWPTICWRGVTKKKGCTRRR
jgi:hypothetical protein